MGPMCCWPRRLLSSAEDGDVVGGGVDDVGVELGVAEVEVAVGEEEGVAAVDVGVGEEGGVVGAAGEGAFEGRGELAGGVLRR